MDKGLYIAEFLLPRRMRLRVGALGTFTFPAGVYLYVGTAQRNRTARIERHGRASKPLRWHIDYLSAKARMLGAVLVPGSRRQECRLAAKLAAVVPRVAAGFGSSDCRCESHLFYAGRYSATSDGGQARGFPVGSGGAAWLGRAGIGGCTWMEMPQSVTPEKGGAAKRQGEKKRGSRVLRRS